MTSRPLYPLVFAAALLGALLMMFLQGCTGGAQQTGIAVSQEAAALTQVALSAQDAAAMRQTCQAAQPALALASNPAMPVKLSGTAIYPAAFCAQLLAGGLPPTTTAGSPAWLGKTLAVTQDVAEVAGVVLPIALKALPLVAAVL